MIIQSPSPKKRPRILLTPMAQPMVQMAQRLRIPKRPVDKQLVFVLHTGLNATQQNTTLITVTFPCTIVGIRWNLSAIQDAGTANASIHWCLNILRDGGTQKVMATTDGATFYQPETDCLAFGVASIDNNTVTNNWSGSTKTMRKMMGGDKFIFSSVGTTTNTSALRGIIQFFCKT